MRFYSFGAKTAKREIRCSIYGIRYKQKTTRCSIKQKKKTEFLRSLRLSGSFSMEISIDNNHTATLTNEYYQEL